MTLTEASLGNGLSEVALDERAHLLRVRGDASRVARELRSAATAAVATGRTIVIVDLSGATQIGGPLAWELSRAHERLLWRAGRVIVVFDSPLLGSLFDAFGLHRSPDVVPTLDAGLAAANVSAAGMAAARGSAAELASATPSGPPGTSAGEPGTGASGPDPGNGAAVAPRNGAAAAPPPFAWRRDRDQPASWSFELAGGRQAPSVARAAAGRVLRGWLDRSRVEAARLLVSEAVSNSVLHGGAGVEADRLELTVTVQGATVRVEVADPAGGFEPPAYPDDPLHESGHGLPVIHSLAKTWGVEPAPDGRVWFELARSAA
jgi:anti-sigma regulatory factor (Ser/Thr protein kinase)